MGSKQLLEQMDYRYDAEGNLTAKQNTANANDRTVYTWDAQNQLVQISQTNQTGPQGAGTSTVTASFTYDSLGRRVQSSIQLGSNPAQTVQYVYEGAQALGEIRSGNLSHRLITGLGLDETIARVALASSGTGAADTARSRQFLTDALNSVMAQMNAATSGGLANSYAYSPYGQSSTVGPDSTANPIQYTSRENDQTGLLFYRARYYDPVMKRFISSDPIGLAGGMNMYGYVGGDPISLTDPLGLMGQGSGRNAKGPQQLAGANGSIGGGGSFHLPIGIGLGMDGGIATDTTGNICLYSMVCYTVGPPGLSGSLGGVASVGSGPLSTGVTDYEGICWSGGAGIAGSGSVLFGNDGSAQVGRGLAGVGGGGSVAYQSCKQMLVCRKD